MFRLPVTRGTHLWYGVTVVFIVVTLGVAFWGLHRTVKNFEAVVHDEEISEELLVVFLDIKVAEDRQRDFLLTHDAAFLEAYDEAVATARGKLDGLKNLAVAEPRLRAIFPRLQGLVLKRLQLLQDVVDTYSAQGAEAAIAAVQSGEGRRVMQEIQEQVREFQAEDMVVSRRLHEAAHSMQSFTILTMAVGIMLTVLASLGTLWKFGRDFDERQKLERRLFEEARLAEVSRRLGDIGHDIKNMLTPIQMGMTLLEDELHQVFQAGSETDREKRRAAQELADDVIAMTKRGAMRIQGRVKEIADAVKGNSSPPRFTACRIQDIVGNVLAALRIYAEEGGVTLHTQGLNDLPVIRADEQRLFNALYNLVNNAIPETPAGGTVTVAGRMSPEGRDLFVSVADTGRGMPPEIVQSLFTGHTVSRKPGGTGLGTKIVKDVIALHEGTITVESQPGKGTRFLIRLPKDGPGDSPDYPGRAPDEGVGQGRG